MGSGEEIEYNGDALQILKHDRQKNIGSKVVREVADTDLTVTSDLSGEPDLFELEFTD